MKTIFEKEYIAEQLSDVERDISECLNEDFNPEVKDIPVGKYGFAEGTFKVTVTWIPE